MAIINSLGIGKSVKSVGNLTYKVVRGRTIASQRITTNKSNTALQGNQRIAFGKVSQAMQLCSAYINTAYEKSKYGSARNNFQKLNKRFNLGGFVVEIKDGIIDLAYGFLSELSAAGTGKSLNFTTFGSLPCIQTVVTETVPTFKYSAEDDILSISNIVGDSIFTFPNAVKLDSLELAIVGIYKSNILIGKARFNEMGEMQFVAGDVQLENEIITLFGNTSASVSNGLVTSVTVSPTDLSSTQFKGMIIVPRVSGKVPTLTSLYLGSPYSAG